MVQSKPLKIARPVRFYRSKNGREPVRDWLKRLPRSDRKVIGRDVLTLQIGWPLGMPLARKLENGLWEIRSRLHTVNVRLIFTVRHDTIVLLHGFMKKSRKTPKSDLKLARQRMERL
jgi:phage-related protein